MTRLMSHEIIQKTETIFKEINKNKKQILSTYLNYFYIHLSNDSPQGAFHHVMVSKRSRMSSVILTDLF